MLTGGFAYTEEIQLANLAANIYDDELGIAVVAADVLKRLG